MTFIPQKNEKYCFISCSEDKIKLGQCSCINNKQRKHVFMKTLELDLKKKVLIVETDNKCDITINKDGIYFYFLNGLVKCFKGNYNIFCKGSELTEENASELVDIKYDNYDIEWYKDYRIINDGTEDDYVFLIAKESFISAVESKDESIDINKCLIFIKK